MESPSTGETTRIAARASIVDSFKGCGLSGVRIDKEELRRRLLMPQYLRFAVRDSIRLKDPTAGESHFHNRGEENVEPPEAPMVVFINPHSGGRHGPVLKERLQQLISEEQVFVLADVKPHEFVRYGLKCLEMLADLGDSCAKETREKMRVMVAGGDGTVGWVLGSLGELIKQGREPFPPVGIIPLGTGNDLSRSFGWGGSFPFVWKSAVKRSLHKAIAGPVCRLDSWHVLLSMPVGEVVDPPHSLKITEECALDEGLEVEGELPEKVTCYEGVLYNYFSIGMDAKVAYGFHHLRNEKPYLAQGPIANKLIYSTYSCTQGWFFTPCSSDPSLRGLRNILRMHVKKVNCSEWEQIPVPSSVRAIVALNLHNYGSGRNPWGNLKPEYLEKRGFVEAHADDGLLEIFGLKQGWHASFVMVELISAKHIAQAAAIRLEVRGGEWKDAYMQMDGEPWEQPLSKDYSTFVEIKRVPFQSLMIGGG
ncbi:diacylglycerol kinase 4-like isoform X1 [Juglans microcarpa x Juglans regia]|uniref:diacylglycerol kinase 4-like isoform X1 n=1 Tax=Juglans microcarpa x Juglans regia TaxID=2249226 RepID=UPI001B7E69F2|nr:diacylglycerol kinase 4-like isoform X1 [Juglans microcarpa x Juglans regia]XP_041019051.1 diacylglycerol kinase 4-like isoform X1 [Juglans microcarpa x Juglans regia]XP_041019052.1 diacylglycerol kinase 4-like isoform X1 [Juglans microcarpa x Juglans regia]XP_041019053.1 diacylglycerol kinase 4-like isoform X1 [Juglans microcarpa x Juglans regia]